MSTHVWSEAVCIGSGVYVPMHEAERVITELENKVDANYQTIAPEVGKDNPGTARIMADIDIHGVGFGVKPVTDYYRGRMLRVANSTDPAVTVAVREKRNIDEVVRGWNDADAECGDADVRPDPYDGGCAADCHDEARRIYLTRVDECKGNAQMLRGMGHTSAADVLGDRAVALVRRIR